MGEQEQAAEVGAKAPRPQIQFPLVRGGRLRVAAATFLRPAPALPAEPARFSTRATVASLTGSFSFRVSRSAISAAERFSALRKAAIRPSRSGPGDGFGLPRRSGRKNGTPGSRRKAARMLRSVPTA